ncbi:MAG TPA: glycerol-3-phosphate 1-O-acyltransferase PlsY [Dongiaceae bacterium]|jgi:glycerol-3-phosphate acyltransferase PlsY|nr:glycerol-3-phosphate 1-O-acyltransferase PlsY [Dongiaceae bacterium]
MIPKLSEALLLGYMLGAIPFGLVLTRLAGTVDIRTIGSGNIGATNVLRTGRRDLAVLTLLLDGAKGALAVWLAGRFGGNYGALLAGLGALLGHFFPVWLGFRGGKGVATGFGVFLALAWPAGVLALLTWLAVALLWRYSSLAALIAMLLAPVYMAILSTREAALAALLFACLIWMRHYENLRRLLTGREPKIGQKT